MRGTCDGILRNAGLRGEEARDEVVITGAARGHDHAPCLHATERGEVGRKRADDRFTRDFDEVVELAASDKRRLGAERVEQARGGGSRLRGRRGKVELDPGIARSEEHTSELQSLAYLVCRLL